MDTSTNMIHKTHSCEITLVWDGLECAKALSFRPIDPDTVTKFHSYFDQGHSPSSALHLHWLNLAIEHNDELEYVRADRSFSILSMVTFFTYTENGELKIMVNEMVSQCSTN